MRIDQFTVFNFRFPFLNGTEMGFAVPGETREAAARVLQEWFEKAQVELSVNFPRMAQAPLSGGTNTQTPTTIGGGLNALQLGAIDELIVSLGKYMALEATRDLTIKKWINLDLTQETFTEVRSQLQLLEEAYTSGVKKIDGTKSSGEIIAQQDIKKQKAQ